MTILNEFKPNLMIAIGGGGYVPARILRYAIHLPPTFPIKRILTVLSALSSRRPARPTSRSKPSASRSTSR